MKHEKLSLLSTASLAVVLSGCATTEPKPITSITAKGYTKAIGEINPLGSQKIQIPDSIFSGEHDGNNPTRLIDGDINTRWSSKGDGSWFVLDYGKASEFNAVRLAFHKGNTRINRFDISVSEDGRVWTQILSKVESSGKTLGIERFSFITIKARYVKYVGYGNTYNLWNSVTEFYPVNCHINTCPAGEFINADPIQAK